MQYYAGRTEKILGAVLIILVICIALLPQITIGWFYHNHSKGCSTPLLHAVERGQKNLVTILLFFKANPQKCGHIFMGADSEMLKYLLDKGLDPNSITKGGSPVVTILSRQCDKNRLAAPNPKLKILLDYGADTNIKTSNIIEHRPSTLLLAAASRRCIGNVQLLLEKGANPLQHLFPAQNFYIGGPNLTKKTLRQLIENKDISPWRNNSHPADLKIIKILKQAEKNALKRNLN